MEVAFFERVIRPNFDRHYFERLEETICGVFASSDYRARAEGRVLASQLSFARGSERYFAVQQAVMAVSLDLGAEEVTARSGNFPMPMAGHKRFVVAVCITDSLKRLYGSKARRLLASINAVLEPFQPDFFDPDAPKTSDTYFGMVVVAKRQGPDQRQPAAIYFGVPSSTLRSWHFYERIDNLIALYDAASTSQPRLTKPRLRKVARSATKTKFRKPK